MQTNDIATGAPGHQFVEQLPGAFHQARAHLLDQARPIRLFGQVMLGFGENAIEAHENDVTKYMRSSFSGATS